MIKGVHRQMIEVTHTGSPYFERAFLVVREGTLPAEEKLRHLADKVVEQAADYAALRRRRRQLWLWRGLFGVGCTAAGALVTWVVEQWV